MAIKNMATSVLTRLKNQSKVIYTLTEFDSRPTRDIDFLIKNLHGSLENIAHIMRDICNISTGNDFITIEVLGTETISADKKYPGVKTSFIGSIGKVRID